MSGMAGDTEEDIGQPSPRIDAIHLRRDDETVHGRCALPAAIGPAEEPRFSSPKRRLALLGPSVPQHLQHLRDRSRPRSSSGRHHGGQPSAQYRPAAPGDCGAQCPAAYRSRLAIVASVAPSGSLASIAILESSERCHGITAIAARIPCMRLRPRRAQLRPARRRSAILLVQCFVEAFD
jgi:hypothetical protein